MPNNYTDSEKVFVINDVSLKIAPTMIQLNEQDLTYSWKTLRTKSTTKMASGHTKKVIHVQIPFKSEMMLDLHRLLVEFRHSPFMFIENRYLREVLCPEWGANNNQKMAFTLRNANVQPAAGLTDVWILDLQLSWFNYFPYTNNWLYREDWCTNWQFSQKEGEVGPGYKYSIGWTYDENGKKVNRPSLIDYNTEASTQNGVLPWSAVQKDYESLDKKTIIDMERMHQGEVFDLLPLPSNMSPAKFVNKPSDSRIYVRYINLLQRDALKRNFNIDCEADIVAQDGFNYFFAAAKTAEGKLTTLSLHEGGELPWYAGLKSSWISKMLYESDGNLYSEGVGGADQLSFAASKGIEDRDFVRSIRTRKPEVASGVRFSFEKYASVRYPDSWVENQYVQRKSVLSKIELGAMKDMLHDRYSKHDSKVENAALIAQMLKEKDASGMMIVAAIVNSAYESGLDHEAVNQSPHPKGYTDRSSEGKRDRRHNAYNVGYPNDPRRNEPNWAVSAGLFQINDSSRAWGNDAGTVKQRWDPVFSINLIQTDIGWPLFEAVANATSDYQIAVAAFCQFVERPQHTNDASIYKDLQNRNLNTEQKKIDFLLGKIQFNDLNLTEFGKHAQTRARGAKRVFPDIESYIDGKYNSKPSNSTSPSPLSNTGTASTDATEEEQEAARLAMEKKQKKVQEQMADFVSQMHVDGWRYYTENSYVTNVWYKYEDISLTLSNSEYSNGEVGQLFNQHSAVVTHVSAGLRHVVADIPIIGQNTPTHQFLGSVQPYYEMEITYKDGDSSLGVGDREGLPLEAREINSMKNILQNSARNFRQIPDSWCASVDCFITRLFGSYEYDDLSLLESKSNTGGGVNLLDWEMTKRMAFTGSAHATLPGHPGVSTVKLTMEETSPYIEGETLTPTSVAADGLDAARSEVLNAVYNWGLDKYDPTLTSLYLAQHAGSTDDELLDLGSMTNTTRPDEEDFGKFVLDDILYHPSETALFIPNDDSIASALNALGANMGEPASSQVAVNQPAPSGGPFGTAVPTVLTNQASPTSNVGAGVGANGQPIILADYDYYDGYTQVRLGEDQDYLDFSQSSVTSGGHVSGDISRLLEENPDLGDIPIKKLLDYRFGLHGLVDNVSLMIAEDHQAGGVNLYKKHLGHDSIFGEALPRKAVVEALYGLPVEPSMWRAFALYTSTYAALTYRGSGESLTVNPKTGAAQRATESVDYFKDLEDEFKYPPVFDEAIPTLSSKYGKYAIDAAYHADNINSNRDPLQGLAQKFGGTVSGGGGRILNAFISPFSGATSVSDHDDAVHYDTMKNMADIYLEKMPARVRVNEFLKFYGYEQLLSGLFAGGADEGDLSSQTGYFVQSLDTSAAWGWDSSQSYAVYRGPFNWQLSEMKDGYMAGWHSSAQGVVEIAASPLLVLDSSLPASLNLFSDRTLGEFVLNPITSMDEILYNDGSDRFSVGDGLQHESDNYASVLYEVSREHEASKVKYFKSAFTNMADDLLIDQALLKYLGLEHLIGALSEVQPRGDQAYPDMELPHHPYYGDVYSVSPDFYMWNIYQDGGVGASDIKGEIAASIDVIVDRSYSASRRLASGGTTNTARKVYEEDSLARPNVKIGSEGKEGVDIPFARPSDKPDAVVEFEERWQTETGADISANQPLSQTGSAPLNFVLDVPFTGPTVSNTVFPDNQAGAFGQALPSTVIPRLSWAESEALRNQMATLLEEKRDMFGSRAGFLGEQNSAASGNAQVEEAAKGNQFERPTASHLFDRASLRKMADGAANTMLTHKYRVARAYPTYKLFFVEEDELTDRFINYDDFYSYAAVKDFYYEEDKMSPVQTAIITLQNISGILDGTKRNAVTDIDHLSKSKRAQKQSDIDLASLGTSHEELYSEANTTDYESQDGVQSFGALALRTGLNVQLRVGYSNDPSDLHVLLSGRVVAVQWNKQGDLAEITVQSFGAELVQETKGWQEDGQVPSYPTTHHLLASMIMEPEVVHFGRWEIGQLYQPGESKDVSFDFTDYSNEGALAHLTALNSATKWMSQNPGLMSIGLIGISAFSLTPAGGSIGRLIGRVPGVGRLASFLGRSMNIVPGRMGVNSFKRAAAGGKARGVRPRYAIYQAQKTTKEAITARLTRAGVSDDVIREVFAVPGIAARAASRSADDFAVAAAARNSEIATRAARALWLGRAEPVFGGVASGGVAAGLKSLFSMSSAWSGTKGAARFLFDFGSSYTGTFLRVAAVTGTAGVLASGAKFLGDEALEAVLPDYLLNAKSFFNATKSRLMLSPQDDNIYAPHPKDYVNMDVSPLRELVNGVAVTIGRSLGFDGQSALGFVAGMRGELTDKKVEPDAVLYTPNGSTIWDIFYEMTYRHPGWVAYNRPYGRRFRYTMFFGVPSQRYWARPADDRFVMRMTELHDYLKNNEISETEYLKLYGDTELLDRLKSQAFSVITLGARAGDTQLTQGTTTTAGTTNSTTPNANNFQGEGLRPTEAPTSITTPHQVPFDPSMDITQTDQYKSYLKSSMTRVAVQEYMRGLDLRFVPFRRYHFISSDTDIVSNGIIVDENSTYNGVHMRYKDVDSSDSSSGEVKTTPFKIHSSLPSYATRYFEADVNPNIKGFRMAQRYAVGIMADNISKMYRGEIVVVGNPQIRVHDVVILSDTINDIHGPIVVEKVTHVMSHEYGFITSIKPAAFVIANELSSWPLLEAMKMYGMAMKDIHASRTDGSKKEKVAARESGLSAFYEGNKSAMDFMAEFGDKNSDDYFKSKYEAIFEGSASAKNLYGGNDQIPNSPFIDDALQDATWYSAFAGGAGLTAAGIATIGGMAGGLKWLNGSEKLGVAIASTMSGGKAKGAAIALAPVAAGLAATAAIEAPSGAALIGSYVLMAQCLHQEAVQIVPLLKNGNPMVGGLTNRDPILVWKSFAGDIRNLADDMINGTSDALDLFKRYGDSLWRELPNAIDQAKDSSINLGM